MTASLKRRMELFALGGLLAGIALVLTGCASSGGSSTPAPDSDGDGIADWVEESAFWSEWEPGGWRGTNGVTAVPRRPFVSRGSFSALEVDLRSPEQLRAAQIDPPAERELPASWWANIIKAVKGRVSLLSVEWEKRDR